MLRPRARRGATSAARLTTVSRPTACRSARIAVPARLATDRHTQTFGSSHIRRVALHNASLTALRRRCRTDRPHRAIAVQNATTAPRRRRAAARNNDRLRGGARRRPSPRRRATRRAARKTTPRAASCRTLSRSWCVVGLARSETCRHAGYVRRKRGGREPQSLESWARRDLRATRCRVVLPLSTFRQTGIGAERSPRDARSCRVMSLSTCQRARSEMFDVKTTRAERHSKRS